MLSHTPYRQLVKHLGDCPVLISGRGNFHHVAREYGFTHSVSTDQLARAFPDALPLSQQGPEGLSFTWTTSTAVESWPSPGNKMQSLFLLLAQENLMPRLYSSPLPATVAWLMHMHIPPLPEAYIHPRAELWQAGLDYCQISWYILWLLLQSEFLYFDPAMSTLKTEGDRRAIFLWHPDASPLALNRTVVRPWCCCTNSDCLHAASSARRKLCD